MKNGGTVFYQYACTLVVHHSLYYLYCYSFDTARILEGVLDELLLLHIIFFNLMMSLDSNVEFGGSGGGILGGVSILVGVTIEVMILEEDVVLPRIVMAVVLPLIISPFHWRL